MKILRVALALALALLVAPTLRATSHVQQASDYDLTGSTYSSFSVTFASPTTSGNAVIVSLEFGDLNPTITVTDSESNTYVQAVKTYDSGHDQGAAIFYSTNISGGASHTVTVHFSSPAAYVTVGIHEYSGIAGSSALDGTAGTTGNDSSMSSGSATTTTNGDLIFGVGVEDSNAAGDTYTAGSGFTKRVDLGSAAGFADEDEIQSSAGSIAATWTLSPGSLDWITDMAAFKPSSGTEPNISSLSPVYGLAGTTVTITGTNFGSTQGSSTVTFNGTTATPASWSATSISVPVPIGASTGNVIVTVSGEASNQLPFTVSANHVQQASNYDLSGTPQSSFGATFGSATTTGNAVMVGLTFGGNPTITVTDSQSNTYTEAQQTYDSANNQGTAIFYATNITGGATPTVTVSFDSALPYVAVGIDEYSGVVPSGAFDGAAGTTGNDSSVSSGSVTTTADGDLIFGVAMEDSVASGDTYTPGTGFIQRVDLASVAGFVDEDGIQSSAGAIAATWTLSPGSLNWLADVAAFKMAPILSAVSPNSGAVSASVTITGTSFGTTQGSSTVKFNGTTATPTSWSATSIVVPVPTGATSGNVVVHVNGVDSNAVSFTVASASSITSLSPTSGAVGASVTIAGANFGATQGSSGVAFNGTSATASSWSATSIVVAVPTGATTGNVVVHTSGVDSNGSSFTVVAAPSITSLSPTSGGVGSSVTITGTDFGATQGSSTLIFNGTAATPTSWSATSITVPVPSGATTGNVVIHASGVDSNGSAFTVAGVVLSSISVTPAVPSLSVSGTQQFTATGTYSDSSTADLTSTVIWSSSATGVATINGTGLATAVAVGTTTIQATEGSISGSTALGVVSETSTGSLSAGVEGQTATVLNNGQVLTVGGDDGTGTPVSGAALYDPSGGTFTATGSLGTARTCHSATLLDNGTVLIVGGYDSDQSPLGSAEIYDPTAGTFSATGSLAVARACHTATLLNDGTVLIAGGYDGDSNALAEAELFIPSSGTFVGVGSLNNARAFQTATLLNDGTVLLAGGYDIIGTPQSSAELFDPSSRTFAAVGSLGTARGNHTATLLNTGKVLIAGGFDSSGNALSSAEVYDPSTTTFGATGSLNIGRAYQTATLLNDGMVLVAGGDDNTSTPLASLELYSPVEGTYVTSGNMEAARVGQSAVLLNSGSVLVVGGIGSDFSVLSAAERYEPSGLTPPSLVSIAVTPATPSVSVGIAQVFTATGTFSDMSTQVLSSATWSSSSTSVAGVTNDWSNHGHAFGLTAGTTTIQGCTGSICGSTTMTVGAATLTISELVPSSGPVGSTVIISGTGFGATQGSSTVTFNGTSASVSLWSSSGIVSTVPTGATTGNVVVTVSGSDSNGVAFTVNSAPSISGLSPTSASSGTLVTISGSNFNTGPGQSVTFNGVEASIASWSSTSISAYVPQNAATGDVVVTTATGAVSNGSSFTVPNIITGFLPSAGPVGASVTIVGAGFGGTQGSNSVTFNGTTAATITSWTSTSIVAVVPTGATTGNVLVTVSGASSNGISFTVLSTPAISSLSATSGFPGEAVTISGSNFGSSQGTSAVTFNGLEAAVTSWSVSSISVTAPTGATTGDVVVTLAGVASNGISFTVTTPPLVSIAVSPATPSVAATATQQFSAIGTYGDATTQDLTATATWSSSVTGAATINSTGLATAVAAGQSTIQATVGSVVGSAILTVPLFVPTGKLETTRFDHTATLLNDGKVLVVGGFDQHYDVLASAEVYDPTSGTFSVVGSLTTARANHTATLLDDGTVLIVGGSDSSSNPLGSAEVYNPATRTFAVVGSLATSRTLHTATLLNTGKVLLAGGFDSTGASASAELYNPASGTFTTTGSLNTGRALHSATLLNSGAVLLAGGVDDSNNDISSSELYDPSAGTFANSGNLSTARESPTASLLNSGLVLVAGGLNSGSDLSSAELYDPTAGTFSTTGSLNTARAYQAATLLTNGMVLMTGGYDSTTEADFASVETYDPLAGTFTQVAGLNTARDSHTATLLKNGTILVAGGFTASAETYTPSSLVPSNLVSISLSPSSPSSDVAVAERFTATGTLSDSTTQQLSSAIWSSSDNTKASITNDQSNHGHAFGLATGSITISACTGSVCGSTTLTVGASTLTSPAISTLSPTSGAPRTSVTLSGTSFGAVQGTGTVSFNGVLAAVSSWTDTGIATSVPVGATTGNVTVTVAGNTSNGISFTVPTLTSISVSPQIVSINANGTLQYTATGTFSDSSEVDISSSATWSSSASSVAAVNNVGFATAASVGQTTIQATVGSVNGSASLAVTQIASGSSLSTTRSGATATLLTNGFILVTGGAPIAADLYNSSTGTFSPTGSMTVVRSAHTATLLNNGTVLVVGGKDSNGNPLNTAEIYDPTAGTFSATGGLSTARAGHTATLLSDGTVLITGGFDATFTPLASAEIFNPATDTFVPVGAMASARADHTATLLNDGTVLIAGGYYSDSSGVLVTAEVYDPVARTFSSVADLNTARTRQTATLLNNGKVLIAGGLDGDGNVLSAAELYDPTAATFTSTGSLATARAYDTATLLNDGVVFIAAGRDNYGDVYSSTELYNPVAGTFSTSTSVAAARALHTATLLPSGTVLLAGGTNSGFFVPVATTEIYQPGDLTPPNLVSITLSPSSPSLAMGTTQVFTATGTFSDSSMETLASATWSSSDITKAIITSDSSNYGHAFALATTGSVTVTACTGSICGSTGPTFSGSGLDLTSLSPASGAIGTPIIIAGTGFGATQGTSTVSFNGTTAAVQVWSTTGILVSVPSGATTGNVVVTVGGTNSNGISFAVNLRPVITSLSPTFGSSGTSVTITGSNFGSSQGSSTVTFNGVEASVTTWSGTSIALSVPSGASSGAVVVTVSGLESNGVIFEVPAIYSMVPADGPIGALVTINGSGFGSVQGSFTVKIGSTAMQVVSWGDAQILATIATGTTTGTLSVDLTSTLSGPTLTIDSSFPYSASPATLSMLVGETRTVTVTTSSGSPELGLVWLSANPGIVSLSADNPPVLTAVAPGNVTVYAGELPITVTVFPGASLPFGTTRWSLPLGGSGELSIVPAVPSSSGVDVFALNSSGTLSAVSSDGRVVWQAAIGSGATVIPDFVGGTFVKQGTEFLDGDGLYHQTHSVGKVDPSTGTVTTLYTFSSPHVFDFAGDLDDSGQIQVIIPSPQGLLFIQDGSSVTLIDPATGATVVSQSVDQDPTVVGGKMIVAGDGNAYLPYSSSTASRTYNSDNEWDFSESDQFYWEVLRVSPDGSYANIQLKSWSWDETCVPYTSSWGVDPDLVFAGSRHCTSTGPISVPGSVGEPGSLQAITNANVGVTLFAEEGQRNCGEFDYAEYFTGGTTVGTIDDSSDCGDGKTHTLLANASQDSVSSYVEDAVVFDNTNFTQHFVPTLQRSDGSYIGTDGYNDVLALGAGGGVLWQQQVGTLSEPPTLTPPVTPLYVTSDGAITVTSTQQGSGTFGTLYTLDRNGSLGAQIADSGAKSSWTANWYADPDQSLKEFLFSPLGLDGTFAAIFGGNHSGTGAAIQQVQTNQSQGSQKQLPSLAPPITCPQYFPPVPPLSGPTPTCGNVNAIEILTSRSVDYVFDNLIRTFAPVANNPVAQPNSLMYFDSATSPEMPISVTSPGQVLKITLQDYKSYLQKPFYVMTERVDAVNHVVSVVTLKGHPLAGWRYWRVYSLGTTLDGKNDVVVETGAYDQPGPGLRNYVGYYLAVGDIFGGWAQYVRFVQHNLNAQLGSNLNSTLGGVRISNVRSNGAFEPPTLVDGYWDYEGALTPYILLNVCESTYCN